MQDPIVEARGRIERYSQLDGLMEIDAGIGQLLIGGWLILTTSSNSSAMWYKPIALIYALVFCAFALFQQRVVRAIRERITYPRIGYVSPGETGRKRGIVIAAICALLPFVAGVLAFRFAGRPTGWDLLHWLQWAPAVFGLTFGTASIFFGVRLRLPRFLLIGILAISLGVAVSFAYPLRLGTAIYFAGVGSALLLSGGMTLWTYLHTTLPPAEEA